MTSKLLRNKTIQNIFKLISGAMLSQIILLASMPLLTRLYTPAEFGLYSLFLSVISILVTISSLRYDQAIVLPKNDDDARALVQLSVLIVCLITLLTVLVEIIFYPLIINHFQSIYYLIGIPIGTFLMGLFMILNAYSARHQFFSTISIAKISNSILLMAIQIGAKLLAYNQGLLSGKILADIATNAIFLKQHIAKKTLQLEKINIDLIKKNAKDYDNFPKFQSATSFINAISQNIPLLMLATLFNSETAGFYGLTLRVLQAPISLVGQSVREVYYQKAASIYANGNSFFYLYKKTTFGLMGLFLVPLIILQLYSNELFTIIFGEEWRKSGTYAKILVIWFLFLFINPPTITSFNILKLQKFQLALEIFSLFLRAAAIYIGYKIFSSDISAIILFMASGVIINIIAMLFIYYKLTELDKA